MSIQAVGQNTTAATGSASATPASSTSATSAAGSSVSTPTSSYTVNISSAARAMLAESAETSVQTAQEAGKGDQQAQRLLAKEAAAKPA